MEIRQLNENAVVIWKEVGETPLEALERFRESGGVTSRIPMTYAGRLDPMAEGELLILIGEECKKKDEYLKFDKEYEVEIVFGIETDTYDALGIAKKRIPISESQEPSNLKGGAREIVSLRSVLESGEKVATFPVVLNQEYPPYSSRTVNGRQLHELARAHELPEEMPSREVTLYSTKVLENGTITAPDLFERISGMISRVKGDFRQEEIKKKWQEVLADPSQKFETMNIQVKCSSGTYMRSLAHELGKEKGLGGFALSIKRTRLILRK